MKHLPIVAKLLSIISVFGVFVVGVTIYATGQLQAVNNGYSTLLQHQQKAAILVAQANDDMDVAQGSIANLLIAKNPQQNQAAIDAIDTARKSYDSDIGQAANLVPDQTAPLRSLQARGVGIVDRACGDTIRAGKVATAPAVVLASQEAYLRDCAPQFDDFNRAMDAQSAAIVQEAQKATDGLNQTTGQVILTTFAVILGGLLAIAVAAFFAIRSWVASPLKGLESAMERLAGGDLTVVVSGEDRRDEIGAMAKTVQVFRDAALEKVRLEAEAVEQRRRAEEERARNEAEREATARELSRVVDSLGAGLSSLAEGDLMFRLTAEFSAEYEKLRSDFNEAMAKLQETMVTVASNTGSIGTGADEIAQASDDLSKRTEQQAASLEETAAALDEITATVKKTASGARQASDAVSAAKGEAEHSGVVVGEAVQAMSQIEKSSQQIGQIIGVIDEIAFQTNLLALNAGVEAARAGDAGRGFAVVAQEVRALAQRSAEAAKEIKALISASSQQVSQGVDLVGQTGKALQSIVAKVGEIDGLVSEISASAQEQATGLNEVNTAVNQMDQVVQQNAAMVEEATAASHSLKGETAELVRLISRFKLGGGNHVRTAPHAAHRHSTPAPSPARALRGRIAANLATAPAQDGWEEF